MRTRRHGLVWPSLLLASGWIGVSIHALQAEAASVPESANTLTAEERASGWVLLFDGKTLAGWQAGSDVDWRVEDGVLRASTGAVGLLHTSGEYADFELTVDFRAAAGTNSGVFLRTQPRPADVLTDCYELNIAPPENPFPTGSLVGRKKVAGVEETEAWRTYEVRVQGGEFHVELDGEAILHFRDPEPIAKGHIGLQFNHGKIEFRNVKIRPLL